MLGGQVLYSTLCSPLHIVTVQAAGIFITRLLALESPATNKDTTSFY